MYDQQWYTIVVVACVYYLSVGLRGVVHGGLEVVANEAEHEGLGGA